MNIFVQSIKFLKRLFCKQKIPELKSVSVNKATDHDLAEMGRVIHNHRGNSSIIIPVRNKKTGTVVMFSGSIDSAKRLFPGNYEIVDSAIKEKSEFEVDI